MAKMNKQQTGAVVVAIALIAGFLVNRGETPVAAEPGAAVAEFDDVGLFELEPVDDDGLGNFFISVSAEGADPDNADPDTTAAPAVTEAPAAPSSEAPPIDDPAVEMFDAPDEAALDTPDLDQLELDLSQLDPDRGTARIWRDDEGRYWARYPDGGDVALSTRGDLVPTSTTSSPITKIPTVTEPAPSVIPVPDDPIVSIDELVNELADDERIVKITVIDTTTLAVETSYTEAELSLRTGGLDIIVDEPVAAFETDPYFGQQWGLENDGSSQGAIADADIDVTTAWASSSGGDGIVIAVLDTGVDFGHPDLAASRWVNPGETCGNGVDDDGNGYVDDCYGWDFTDNDATSWDGSNHFHGTHVAGISSARVDNVGVAGVAPQSIVMDVRVLDARGSGQTSGIAAGVRYAVDNGADVINVSLGAQPGLPRHAFAPVEQALAAARAQGVIVVAAAGNSNTNIDASPVWPASFAQYYDNIIAVASTDAADGRSSFSNYGAATVDIAAPGSDILSTMPNGRWSTASGTSMAAPMVAGAVALVAGDAPGITPADALRELTNAADAVPSLEGRVAQSIRLNVGNLYAERSTAPVDLLATGLSGVTADRVISAQLTLKVNDAATFTNDAFVWDGRLLAAVGGAAYAVVEHPVTVGATSLATDTAGAFELSAPATLDNSPGLTGRGDTISLSTQLPAGTYALIVEAVALDGTVVNASTNTLYFVVGDAQVPAGPDPTDTPAQNPTGPTTTASVSTGPVPTQPAPTGPVPTGPTPTEPIPTGPSPTGPTQTTTVQSNPGNPIEGPTPTTVDPAIPAEPTPIGPTPTTSPSPAGPAPTGPTPTTTPSGPTPTDPTPTGPTPTGPTPTTSAGSPGEVPPADQSWRVDLITPNEGFINSNGLVTLFGSFPQPVHVWFGNSAATTKSASDRVIVVNHPRFATTGLVDVRLVNDSGVVMTMPDAFLFIDGIDQRLTTTTTGDSNPGDTPGTTVPTDSPTPGSTPGASPTTTTTSPSQTTPTTATPPGQPDGGTDTPAPGTETPVPTTRVERTVPSRFIVGPAVDHTNGLRLALIESPGSPTSVDPAQWPTSACSTVVCTAVPG